MKALIIDDEIDICYLLSGILKNKDIQPFCVNTLAEAKNALKSQDPEIIFIDNHLPDGMGVDFIQQIKIRKPNAKVVLITAYDTAIDRKRAEAEGVDFFIAKPFTRETIYQTVDLFAV
ncbi:MAG TPA: response regulator [Ferruginibacter sp.]|nr:response regulator [Ferruginibacter sp.]